MKNGLLKFLFFLYPLFAAPSTQAQSLFQHSSLGVQGYYGSFLTNVPKAQYVKDSYTYFGELYWQHQTDGSKPWHVANNWPQMGAALFYGQTGSRQFIGKMGGAFLFTSLPLLRTRTFSSRFRIGTGAGWVQKPYDKITNHKNVLIGSHLNVYINFLLQNEFKIAPATFLNAGLSFSHLSNAGTTLPNLGLNIPALSVGLRYGGKKPITADGLTSYTYTPKTSLRLFTAAGVKQIPWIESSRYLVNTASAELQKRFSFSNAWGGGVIAFYDRSLQVDPTTITSNKRDISKIQLGVFASFEHSIGHLSLPVQLGAIVVNRDINPVVFQQIGIRYQFSQKWLAQLLLKSYGGRADLIHAGIGYKLK